jgi:ankyrin repeat protein
MSAAWWGALDLVQLLLPSAVARGALDEGDDSELTALRYAAHAGPEVVQALLDARADPNATDIHGTFPLFVAKDRESIVLLLAAGADPNMRRPGPLDTALHERCRHGDAGAVEALLAGGAMADLRASGQTTLLLAAVSGSDDTVLHLLRHASPALINALDDNLRVTALLAAVVTKAHRAIEALVLAGADPNVGRRRPLSNSGDARIVRLLLDHGADIDFADADGFTAVHAACVEGDTEVVAQLLQRGADATIPSAGGYTVLHTACEFNHGAIFELLLRHPPLRALPRWIDTCNDHGLTALSLAVQRDFPDIVKRLLEAKASVHRADARTRGPLVDARSAAVTRMLLDAGAVDVCGAAEPPLLMHACRHSPLEVVHALAERGVAVHDVTEDETPLSIVVKERSLEFLPALLVRDRGYINVRSGNGRTVLFDVARAGRTDMARIVLDLGCDPRVADADGLIALMSPLRVEMMRVLVDAAPDTVHHRDQQGRTVLMCYCGAAALLPCVAALLAGGEGRDPVDADVKSLSGDSAVQAAMAGANAGAVELLLERGVDVMGCGYGGTTALMKPFMGEERVAAFGDVFAEDEMSMEELDARTSYCLELVINQVVQCAMREERVRGEAEEPPAKRRKV